MNVFNRIALAVLCLALVAGAVSIIVLAWTIPVESIDALQDAVDWLRDNNEDLQKVVLTAGAAAVGLVSLMLLLLEVTPPRGMEVKVTDVKVGDAVLTTAAIGQRIEEALRDVPHVAEARASVRATRKGVQVSLDLHVDPEANLATVSDEACQAARDVLAEKVHVALAGPPRARLHYRELRLQRAALRQAQDAAQARAARRPATPSAPPAPVAEAPPPEPAAEASAAVAPEGLEAEPGAPEQAVAPDKTSRNDA